MQTTHAMTTKKTSNPDAFQSLVFAEHSQQEMQNRANDFLTLMQSRRSVRDFSDKHVPKNLIELAIATASTAPSGANMQPWKFIAVSNPDIKNQIRIGAEKEEQDTYDHRMSEEWRRDLQPMGTTPQKPFLEVCPWLVILMEQPFGITSDGQRKKHYYVKESVGIAAGMFITAIHNMGLATVTHTPSPMKFLSKILKRPANERPFMLFPIGYPSEDAKVPVLTKKQLDEVATFV